MFRVVCSLYPPSRSLSTFRTRTIAPQLRRLASIAAPPPLPLPRPHQTTVPPCRGGAALLTDRVARAARRRVRDDARRLRALGAPHVRSTRWAGLRAEVRAALLKYLDSDTTCFYQDYLDPLVCLQDTHWKPLLAWARGTFGIGLLTSELVLFSSQPAATKAALDKVLQGLDPWQMTAMERATYTTKYFIIALVLAHGRLTAEEAALASQVEVASQIEHWGEVEDTHEVDYHDVRRHLGSAACLSASV
ncbi:hypothetical protein BC834DRAFT_972972 [Gloeopeniophorella convolvens]|nr:hypothetical protein BC834DRAFT_972972 [Gloeopeniophorella convolvens]